MAAQAPRVPPPGPPVHCGMLLKRGELNKAWKERWFELHGRWLFYMKSRGDKPLASVDLSVAEAFQVRLSHAEPAPFAFEVVTRSRLYFLRAITQRDLDDWFHALTNLAALPPENATMAKAEERLRAVMLRRAAALEESTPLHASSVSPSSSMRTSSHAPTSSFSFSSTSSTSTTTSSLNSPPPTPLAPPSPSNTRPP